MTAPHRPDVDQTAVVLAEETDLDVLSHVIADAFVDLAPSRWLITDPGACRRIFPGYFRLYLEHAQAAGLACTTPGRTAAALWLPVGEGPVSPPDGYDARLAAATGAWADRFRAFDAALDDHHPTGTAHWHLAILAVHPDQQGQGTGSDAAAFRPRTPGPRPDARLPGSLQPARPRPVPAPRLRPAIRRPVSPAQWRAADVADVAPASHPTAIPVDRIYLTRDLAAVAAGYVQQETRNSEHQALMLTLDGALARRAEAADEPDLGRAQPPALPPGDGDQRVHGVQQPGHRPARSGVPLVVRQEQIFVADWPKFILSGIGKD